MSAVIIDGKQVAADVRAEVAEKVSLLKQKGITPCLAVILVGENPASVSYVTGKQKALAEVGMVDRSVHLPESTSEEELLKLIDQLNADDTVHGILVQLPLPKHINEEKVIMAISPEKDVDGFHPVSVGNLMIGRPGFLPCTPHGIIVLLKKAGIETSGKHAVVIDVGVNRIPDSTKKSGFRLIGDCDFDDLKEKTSFITPVPGGVGPMTIAMLMQNTLESAERKAN